MSTPPPATPDGVAAPVTGHERIDALDTLRGVAVLGILVMNIYAFAMPFAAYMNPLLMGGLEWYNLGTWFATHIFFDQKFMTIFSMLFGAGLVMMWQRAEARNAPFARVYYRRQFWLLVIGAMHAYLLWFGDILFYYAVIGMLIYPLRKLRPRTLVIIACCLLPVGMLMNYGGYYYMSDLKARSAEIVEQQDAGEEVTEEQQAVLDEWEEARTFIMPSVEAVQEDVDAHRGTYLDALTHRAPQVAMMQVQGTIGFALWRIGGLMLLGMAFMKLGILSGERDGSFYRRLMLAGYGLGLPLTVYSCFDLYAHAFDGLYVMKQGGIANYVGSLLVAFGHIGLTMLIVRARLWQGAMQRFAAVGRMAFTNYLMHTVILTTVFFGYGFGLYGHVPRLPQMAFVVAVIAFQLWLSPWWLARYRFGPAEWLWRSLTYWRRQAMRQPHDAGSTA
jgi:uncharacterized protein